MFRISSDPLYLDQAGNDRRLTAVELQCQRRVRQTIRVLLRPLQIDRDVDRVGPALSGTEDDPLNVEQRVQSIGQFRDVADGAVIENRLAAAAEPGMAGDRDERRVVLQLDVRDDGQHVHQHVLDTTHCILRL